MTFPNIAYIPNSCQYVPQVPCKEEAAGRYKIETAMKLCAVMPSGIGRIASVVGGIHQIEFTAVQMSLSNSWDTNAALALQMAATAGMIGLSVLSPYTSSIVSTFIGSYASIKALIEGMRKGDELAVIVHDILSLKMGMNIIYLTAMISGNPVLIAISLVAHGVENIYEGGCILVKQLNTDKKDWMMIMMASLEVGLGALRGCAVQNMMK